MSARSTAVRWFEKLMESTKTRVRGFRELSLSSLLERVASLGDEVFPRIVHLGEVVADKVNRLQITMLESMLLASLWFGFVCILVLLALLLLA